MFKARKLLATAVAAAATVGSGTVVSTGTAGALSLPQISRIWSGWVAERTPAASQPFSSVVMEFHVPTLTCTGLFVNPNSMVAIWAGLGGVKNASHVLYQTGITGVCGSPAGATIPTTNGGCDLPIPAGPTWYAWYQVTEDQAEYNIDHNPLVTTDNTDCPTAQNPTPHQTGIWLPEPIHSGDLMRITVSLACQNPPTVFNANCTTQSVLDPIGVAMDADDANTATVTNHGDSGVSEQQPQIQADDTLFQPQSAECVVEAPGTLFGVQPLADFGTLSGVSCGVNSQQPGNPGYLLTGANPAPPWPVVPYVMVHQLPLDWPFSLGTTGAVQWIMSG